MKKSLLVMSSAFCSMAFLIGCGNGGQITTAEAKEIAKIYDSSLSDSICKSSTVTGKVNKASFEGTGVIGYYDLSKGGGLRGFDLTGTKISLGAQDLANISVPNSLLYTMQSEKGEEDTTYSTLSYLLAATVSEDMISWYSGNLEAYGIDKWENMSVSFSASTNSKGNKTLSAIVKIDNFQKFADEFTEKTKMPAAEYLTFFGDGKLYAEVGCDDLGYISKLNLQVSGDNIEISEGQVPETNIDSSFNIFSSLENIDPEGIKFKGKMNIDVNLNIAHEAATEYAVKFRRTTPKEDGTGYDVVDISDIEKDDCLVFNQYQPIKYDPVRKTKIYGAKDKAYEEIGYDVVIKTTDESKFKFKPSSNGEETEECVYKEASVSINGINVPLKEESESSYLDTSYCYFKALDADGKALANVEEGKDNETPAQVVLHISRNTIAQYCKYFSSSPNIVVNLDLVSK